MMTDMNMMWQPIKTAPKDGTHLILFCPVRGVVCPGRWDENRYARTPRPFWTHWGERTWGTMSVRNDQPTHWCPIPEPPKDQDDRDR